MKRYKFDRDLSEYYHWPICNCEMLEDPDGEWVSFSELPIITRKPETVEDVVALVKVLYGPGRVVKTLHFTGVYWLPENCQFTAKEDRENLVQFIYSSEWVGEGEPELLPWATEDFAGIAPKNSLTEVV